MIYDVIIIGSGPAGYTAAIYTSRAFLKTLVITGTQPGGQLTTTTEVENFPGFPDGIQGPELLQHMKVQAERFGSEIVTDVISNVKCQMSNAKLNSNSKTQTFLVQGQDKEYEAKAVIIATGANPKTLGIPSEEKFRGKGISYCATCDGFFFRGKNVAVLGGGDTAMEEATFLTRFAEKVTIIHRREGFRASPIMVDRAKKNPKITFLLNTVVEEFYGDTALRGVRLRNTTNPTNATNTTNEIQEILFDGVFVAIGHTPATAFLKSIVAMDEKGYIQIRGMRSITDPHTLTSTEGIFAAGDCVDMRYRQGIVAAGMGCMAAIDVQRWLTEKGE
jgi:thioredoxin reductase (NADPH)